MPKPQHVDDKLYDNILLLFLDGFYRTSVVFVPLSVRVSCAPKEKSIFTYRTSLAKGNKRRSTLSPVDFCCINLLSSIITRWNY